MISKMRTKDQPQFSVHRLKIFTKLDATQVLDWKMLPAAPDDDDGSWVIGKMLLWKLRRTL